MPSFTRELEKTLHNALAEAARRTHEYATLEHLLLALTGDTHALAVLKACSVDIDELQSQLARYLDTELTALKADASVDPSPTGEVEGRTELKVRAGGRQGCSDRVVAFGDLERHRTAWHDRGDGVLVDHLGHGVAQQHHVLVEGLDVALKLDAVDQVDRNGHVLFAQQVQKGVLQELAFIAHDMFRVG